jgi:hypothetical protein
MSSDWPARWPQYLPFPYPIGRDEGPVPNRQAIDWPQSQFAPLFLPAGSPSYQPYVYKDGPYPAMKYVNGNLPPYDRQSGVGPGGDLARLPAGTVSYPFALGDAVESSMDQFVPLDESLVSRVSAFNQERIRTLEHRIQTLIGEGHLEGTPQAQMLHHLRAVHARVSERLERGPRRRQMRRRAMVHNVLARIREKRSQEVGRVGSLRARLAQMHRAEERQDAVAENRIRVVGQGFTPSTSVVVTQTAADQSTLLRRRVDLVTLLRMSWPTMARFQIINAMQEINEVSAKLGLPTPTEIPVEVVRIAAEAKTNPRNRARKLRRSKCSCED